VLVPIISLIICAGSALALEELRRRELQRRRAENFRAWVMKDLPPID